MNQNQRSILITPTWAGDVDHFRLMRRSLELSPLSGLPHYVVVQTEDIYLFEEFRGRPGLHLQTTADVLPAIVEKKRVRARRLSTKLGRNFTRIAGSVARAFSWPEWPSFTGWHTQQLCKLQLASTIACEQAIVLDSDVLVTKHATMDDFLSSDGVVCLSTWELRASLKGKVFNWVNQAESLVNAPLNEQINSYFDTPFVLDQALVREMLCYLSATYHKAWWQVMLDCPPRRWSEFGVYNAFLSSPIDVEVVWRKPEFCRYIYDTSDPEHVIETVATMLADKAVHYITIHSHSSGRETWSPQAFLARLMSTVEGNASGVD